MQLYIVRGACDGGTKHTSPIADDANSRSLKEVYGDGMPVSVHGQGFLLIECTGCVPAAWHNLVRCRFHYIFVKRDVYRVFLYACVSHANKLGPRAN